MSGNVICLNGSASPSLAMDPGSTSGDEQRPPLTIYEWKHANAAGGGLERLLSLLGKEREAQSNACIALASDDAVRRQWEAAEAARAQGADVPLFGVPFAAKDNIDAVGFPREPVRENSLLGTYTNFVNFLDWSALSIPAGFCAQGLPFGITIISTTWQEPKLVALAKMLHSGGNRTLGATSSTYEESKVEILSPLKTGDILPVKTFSVAVVGAHLRGFLLNKDLTSRGAIFAVATKTAPRYRLFSLAAPEGAIRKPGLQRVGKDGVGSSIEVEVWNLPESQFVSFFGTTPSPLGLGSVELATGSWVFGFIREPFGLDGAADTSHHGGWRNYMAAQSGDSLTIQVENCLRAHDLAPCNGILPASRPIKSVLIANRGEIAVRIIKTLREMSVKSIAVYSRSDAAAEHVRTADAAWPLAGETVSETYPDPGHRKKARADAVIPGYEFLAENADFAGQVEEAGLIWVGPTPEPMLDMGLKHRAREIAQAAGVPTVPGSALLSDGA